VARISRQYFNLLESTTLSGEYDFSKAERGRFYRPDAVLVAPVHLDPEVLAILTARAVARGMSLSELVNALLKKDIEPIEGGRSA
jgi:hypothetical protein